MFAGAGGGGPRMHNMGPGVFTMSFGGPPMGGGGRRGGPGPGFPFMNMNMAQGGGMPGFPFQ